MPTLWLLAPLGLMLAFGLFKEAYLKFLLIASPALALLLARGLLLPLALLRSTPRVTGAAPTRSAWLALAWLTLGLIGVSAGAALALNVYYTDSAFARDDYRGMVRTINALATPQDAILLDAPGQRDVFSYYYRGNLPVLALPAQRPPLAAETTATWPPTWPASAASTRSFGPPMRAIRSASSRPGSIKMPTRCRTPGRATCASSSTACRRPQRPCSRWP
ncbi:MAG: hypothetical protein IPO15_16990 [Anaerolineae bacterium]|uniref:hypothetical protein n=1 Tax=Candidatus Amarolinea dominans TaxID=3140696 RepID=UPI0031349355|nr:hypothetical protein [Anaerolineae bacterium]